MSGWRLTEDRFVPELAPWKESLFSIGNGYLGTRGSFEEGILGEIRSTFINGLFVTPQGDLPLLGAVPDWTRCLLSFDREPFSLLRSPPGYRRELDMSTGVLSREILWKTGEGGVVKVGFRRLLSMAQPHLAALEVTITSLSETVEVSLETGIDAGVPSPASPAWSPRSRSQTESGRIDMMLESVDGRHQLDVATRVSGIEPLDYLDHEEHPRFRGRFHLEPGRSKTLTKFTVYNSSRDRDPDPTLPGEGVTFDDIARESAAVWAGRWDGSRIDIDGDPDTELALRFAAFQLVGAAAWDDPGSAIGAKLLSGFGYRHHVFWDTDIFIVPWFTVAHPDLARSHLAYRYRGLPGARRKAERYGRQGAFYAWESADTGDETTPEWSTPHDGDPVRIWTGQIEEHIVADVAYAVENHWRWTGDDGFMRREGSEMILDGARYWAGRVEVSDGAGHIRGVIGPDEYHTHVDDSFYTNAMAAWHLRTAANVMDWLNRADGDTATRLADRLGITNDIANRWREVADSIVLLQEPGGVWEQHAGFFGLDEVDLTAFEPRHRSVYELLGESRVEKSQVIKQADVVMAISLLTPHLGPASNTRANWDYYLHRTDHGSSLSPAVHSMVAARLGLVDDAYRFLQRTIAIDMADSMGNGRDGIHAASQGGLLQAVLFGFGGLRLERGEPVIEPHLPHHWKSLGFSFMHRGARHEREITQNGGSVSRRPSNT